MILWISESQVLPRIGQAVLFAAPRQSGEFWDLRIARLLVRHESVVPQPVAPGSRWPSDYYWACDHFGKDTCLVTGNGWWTRLDKIPLPPGAVHQSINGFHCIVQSGDVFIPQGG